MNRRLLSPILLGLSLGCQMGNPAFDQADAGETQASGDGDLSTTNAEGNTSIGDGDGDASTGDGDGDGDTNPGDGDGDTSPGDGDGDTNTGDGDGDTNTGDGDGDSMSGDGDGDGGGVCGDDVVDPGEECDDGNAVDSDGCESNCTETPMGDGDGDGDGDPNMMQCVGVMPQNCPKCLEAFCCSPEGLACAADPNCMCMLPCLANMGGEVACASMCNMAGANTIFNATSTLECAEVHCQGLCIGG